MTLSNQSKKRQLKKIKKEKKNEKYNQIIFMQNPNLSFMNFDYKPF